MKNKSIRTPAWRHPGRGLMATLMLLAILHPQLSTFAQNDAFTYQGRLTDQGTPANGVYDLQFNLYREPTNGSLIAGPVMVADLAITNGLFTALVDFGAGAFDGGDRFIEIAVRPGASVGAFTAILPRQAVTPTPYALFAADAGNAVNAVNAVNAATVSGPVPASQLAGTLTYAQLPTNVARLNVPNTAQQATGVPVVTGGFVTAAAVTFGGSGYLTPPGVTVNAAAGSGAVVTATIAGGAVNRLTVTDAGSGYTSGATLTIAPPPSNAYQTFSGVNIFTGVNTFSNGSNSFTGNGGGLTNLNSANLVGTVPDARLSSNVALRSGGNNFSGVNTFSNAGNSFTGNGGGLTNLNPVNLVGTVPDARLSSNVALRNGGNIFNGTQIITNGSVAIGINIPAATLHVNGTARVEGNTTIDADATITGNATVGGNTTLSGNATVGDFFVLSRSTITVTDGMTLVPTTSFVRLIFTGNLALNATTAIANGSAIGTILILQVSSTVAVGSDVFFPNNANILLDTISSSTASPQFLGANDTLTLIWDGSNWVQLSASEYTAP